MPSGAISVDATGDVPDAPLPPRPDELDPAGAASVVCPQVPGMADSASVESTSKLATAAGKAARAESITVDWCAAAELLWSSVSSPGRIRSEQTNSRKSTPSTSSIVKNHWSPSENSS